MCCVYCRTIKILISIWPRTRKVSQLLQTVGSDFSHHGHALVTLYVQFLCSDWSIFDWWVHAEDLWRFILFNLTAEEDRVLCQLVFVFCFFNCLFPQDVQNEIQLLSWVFSYSWLVCLLSFWLRNTSLVNVGNPISNGIIFFFTLLDV